MQMDRRTANLLQAAGLVAIFWLTSRDIDRTIRANEEPVSNAQNKALANYVEGMKPRAPGL